MSRFPADTYDTDEEIFTTFCVINKYFAKEKSFSFEIFITFCETKNHRIAVPLFETSLNHMGNKY